MKRLIFCFIVFCTIIFSTKAQTVTFEWQPDGSMLTKDGETYEVVYYDGKTKEELYNELLVSVSSLYNNPQEIISTVENKLISINAIMSIPRYVGGLLGRVDTNFHYVLKIHVKDGKIKVDAPYFTLLTFSTGGTQQDIEGWTRAQKFFKKDGTPSDKKGEREFYFNVNSTFNELINAILKLEADNDDW
jgi:hypothetical protein